MASTFTTLPSGAGLAPALPAAPGEAGAYTAGRGFPSVEATVANLAARCTVRVSDDGGYLVRDGHILSFHSASEGFWLAAAKDAVSISGGRATFLLFPEFSIGLAPFLLRATCAARRDGLNIHLAEAVVPLRDWPVSPEDPPASFAGDEPPRVLWPGWRGFLSSARADPA